MIKEEHFYFPSAEGTMQIHGMRWVPEGEVKAVFQITHGMSEHIERYRDFAMYLAGLGILVVGHDHLGHGGSVPSEKEFGYFAKENGNKILVSDIHRLVRMTKRDYKKLPYILLGHSMGSFLARQYLCQHGGELDGAIICGTGYHSYAEARLGMLVAKSEALLHGWEYRSRLLWWMTFGSFNAKFKDTCTDCDWLCRDYAVVEAYIRDPLCGFAFTVNGYYNMLKGISKIARPEYLERMPKELPVLFIAGESDPVGNFGKGVRRVEKEFRKIGMQHVACKLYPEDRHELLNELDKKTVYKDIVKWLEENGLLQN